MCDEELPTPWLPRDVTRPFFAYGLFMPGQLAYFQIRDLATSTPATVTGQLRIRDGVPFLAPSAPGYSVTGALVSFAPADAEEGYGRIAAMEPKHLYSWGTIAVDDGVNDNGVDANVLLGRSPEKGHPLDWPDWDGWEDPLFVKALPLIERRAKAVRRRHDYEALFDRQMAYMLLWSAIERYLSLRYSLGEDVNQKIAKLAKEDGFKDALRRHVSGSRDVRRASDPGKTAAKLDPSDPKASADYYYRVRSNVTHRGKTASETDGEVLQKALDELLPIFNDVLAAAKAEAQDEPPPSLGPGFIET
jgi:Gamma-glutamyl cyclotransferase, AIG2-like